MSNLADFDVFILPGLNGSGPDHWQTHWENAFPDFKRIEQDNWDQPVYSAWAKNLTAAVENSKRPILLIAHSLGTALVVRWAAQHPALAQQKVAAALLVATTDIDRFEGISGSPATGFAPTLLQTLPFHTVVVASHDDERVTFERATTFAHAWGTQLIDAGYLGHMGTAAKLGIWPLGLVYLGQLIGSR